MPTLPIGEPHRQREIAESFGADAERYDRARPRYPDAMVAAVVAGSPGVDVLDVGVGTGIAARQFRAAGCRVLGVDVDPRMGEVARQHGIPVEVAAFEAWEAAGRTFDAVIAAQTWHWVDPVAGAVRAASVLRPGGRLALCWNVFRPPADLAEAFSAVHRRVLPDAPLNPWTPRSLGGHEGVLIRAADGIRRAGTFGAPEQWRFEWTQTSTRDEWLAQMSTSGGTHSLPPTTRDALEAGIGAVVEGLGGTVTMPYTTVVLTAIRAPRA